MNEERLFLIDICYKCSHNLNNKLVYITYLIVVIIQTAAVTVAKARTTSVFITSLNLGLQDDKVSEVVI